ncbi:MAG: hypothetical protein JSR61_15155 [Proteobacteria bacterium]|nr:hypothetical protein [Pseudomonadota bacterium]
MYRLAIWVIALALVFNGVPSYDLDGASAAPTMVASDHHADAFALDCNVHSNDVAVIAADTYKSQHAAHDHLKCCPTCNVVSTLPTLVAVAERFAYGPASFRTVDFGLVGHLVALDPDIPKIVA